MKLAEYEPTDKRNNYDEMYQSTGVKFSIVTRKGGINRQISPFFECRDFLSDAFWSIKTKKPVSIYNFCHPPEENFLRGRLRLLVKFPGAGNLSITSALKLLNAVEKDAKIQPTRVYRTKEKGEFLVSSAKFWAQNPVMISFLTFVIRQGTNLVKYNIDPNPETFFTEETHEKMSESTDKHTSKFFAGYNKIKQLLASQNEVTGKFKELLGKEVPANDIHYHTGIASLLSGEFQKMYDRRIS